MVMNLEDIITSFLSRWRGGSEPKSVRANYGTMGPEQFNPYMSYEQQQSNPDLVFGPNASPLNIRNFGKAGFSTPEEYAAAIRSGGISTSQAQPDDFGIIKEVLGAQEKPIAPSRPTTEAPKKKSGIGYDGIVKYAQDYKNESGFPSRMTSDYLGMMWDEINQQFPDATQDQKENLLASVLAISLTETGMGAARANAEKSSPYYRKSNFWGWFKNRDRSYDPEQPEMAKEIVRGLGSGYGLIGQDMNMEMAKRYSGSDRAERWLKDYEGVLDALGYLD